MLSNKQYWIVILVAILFLGLNGFLVHQLLNDKVEFDYSCPVPKEKISGCECLYDRLFRDQLKFCTCWPKGINRPNQTEILYSIQNNYTAKVSQFNASGIFSFYNNGTTGNS